MTRSLIKPTEKEDNFFTDIANTKPYFKAALQGFAGTGKTYTSALIAVGLHKRIGSKKPVVIFDTEKAAKFLKPLFAENNIEVLIRESRSLADLVETMHRVEAGASDILLIDSISHVWENYLESYKTKVRRTQLQFQDWGIIKPTWKREFSDIFVSGMYHVIMCGRAGYEYDSEINEDTMKREIYKSGVKMKVEGETAYEPDLLVLMERYEEVIKKDEKKVWREATVLKDRSTLLDGKTFKNPSYDNFAPSIEAMLENPFDRRTVEITPERDTALLFKTEEQKAEWKRDRDIQLERIDGLLSRIWPGSVGKDKAAKLEILEQVFGTTSETEIKQMRPEDLKEGYRYLQDLVVSAGFAKYITKEGKKVMVVSGPQEPEKKEVKKEVKKEEKPTAESK